MAKRVRVMSAQPASRWSGAAGGGGADGAVGADGREGVGGEGDGGLDEVAVGGDELRWWNWPEGAVAGVAKAAVGVGDLEETVPLDGHVEVVAGRFAACRW